MPGADLPCKSGGWKALKLQMTGAGVLGLAAAPKTTGRFLFARCHVEGPFEKDHFEFNCQLTSMTRHQDGML